MQHYCEEFLFSKEDRNAIPIAIGLLLMILLMIGIVSLVSFDTLHSVFCYYLVALVATLGYLLINHAQFKKYRLARYVISEKSVSLKCGSKTISISQQDDYYVSILRLFKPRGKSYAYLPYIVFWKDTRPVENVHPFVLLKKQYILLPLSPEVEIYVKIFTKTPDLPTYPQSFHHSAQKQK